MKRYYFRIIFVYFLVVTSIFFRMYKDNNDNKIQEEDIKNSAVQEIVISNNDDKTNYKEKIDDLRKLYNNQDVIGIFSIDNTNFNEVVMQTNDNEYYLDYSISGNYDQIGQAFLDYRVNIKNGKKLIIYGHNSNYLKLPFSIFENYYNEDYYLNHKYLYLQTEEGINKYLIFSVYIEVSDFSYYSKMYFKNDDDYLEHISSLKDKSIYDTGVNIDKNSEILIIQTCSTLSKYMSYDNSFLLVIGKKI